MKQSVFIPVFLVASCASQLATYSIPPIPVEGVQLAEIAPSLYSDGESSPLSVNDLATLVVINNPDLKAMRLQVGVADAQIFAAGLLPDPSIGLGLDFPLNAASEVTAIAASTGLDLAGLNTRSDRIELAELNASQIRKEILWAEWITHQNAILLATRISWLEGISAITDEYLETANIDLEHAIRAASRGDISAIEVNSRRLTAVDASDRARAVESQLAAARLDLNRLLGLTPDAVVEIAPISQIAATEFSLEQLFEIALDHRIDLQALQDGLTAASMGQSIAEASSFPLPSISINAGRDTGNIRTLGPSVGFTLPLWNRRQGDIAIAEASLAQLEGEYLTRAESIRSDIGAALSAFLLAEKQLDDLLKSLTDIEELSASIHAAAERGDLSETSAAATRLTVLDREITAEMLRLASSEALIALETAVGKPLEARQ